MFLFCRASTHSSPHKRRKYQRTKNHPPQSPCGGCGGWHISGFGVSKQRVQNKLLVLRQMPLPVDDLRQILANFVDVVLMSNQLVVHLLDQISALVAQLRQVLQGILNQVEAVDLVLHAHIERRGDGAFLLVAMDRQVALVRS